MLTQHLYEPALCDGDRNWQKRQKVENEVSLLSTSALRSTSNESCTTTGEGTLSSLGHDHRQMRKVNRRLSTRSIVGIVLGLMFALAVIMDVTERYVHVSNFRRHGMALHRRRSEPKANVLRGQRRRRRRQI